MGVSTVLFVIFWMGTLSVFDKEIDQWMIPETRSSVIEAALDPILLDDLNSLSVREGSSVFIQPPISRVPTAQIHYDHVNGEHIELFYRADTGERIILTESYAGSGFIFPFHFTLHMPWGLGLWIKGLAALAMLVLLVSGIFIHRKIIADFFTFRPQKKLRRSTLDLHNLTSVVALPFHVLFPLTALFILITTFFPWSTALPYGGDKSALYSDLYGSTVVREAAGEAGGADLMRWTASSSGICVPKCGC
ncbi:MAG: PepSY-associated TM helix domain-containing protein [Pseudomonadota bacterium]